MLVAWLYQLYKHHHRDDHDQVSSPMHALHPTVSASDHVRIAVPCLIAQMIGLYEYQNPVQFLPYRVTKICHLCTTTKESNAIRQLEFTQGRTTRCRPAIETKHD